VQAHRIVRAGGESIGLEVSCHSLRKTFGYHAWKNGTPPALLMKIYNHSGFEVTKRYLCIEQEDKDAVFKGVEL
jgi:integrase